MESTGIFATASSVRFVRVGSSLVRRMRIMRGC